jgi:hypothetical protein
MRARTLPKEKCRVEQFLDSFKEEPGNEHGWTGWTGSKNRERLAKRLGVGRPLGSRSIIFLFPLRPSAFSFFTENLKTIWQAGFLGWRGFRSGRAVCMP